MILISSSPFKVLGRHVWRCKSRTSLLINTPIINQPSERFSTSSETITFNIESPNVSITNINNTIPPTNESPDDRTFNDLNDNDDDIAISDDVNDHNSIDIFQCYCGKKCKGVRGLQAHKRACKILEISDLCSLDNIPPLKSKENESENNETPIIDKINLLPGVNLPQSTEQWEKANFFFNPIKPGGSFLPAARTFFNNFRTTLHMA